MTPSNGSARGRCRRSARRPTQAMRRPSSQPVAVGSRLPTTAPRPVPASPPALAPRLGRGAGKKTRYRAGARTGGNPRPRWHSPAETCGGCAGLQAEEYQGHGTAEGDESPAPPTAGVQAPGLLHSPSLSSVEALALRGAVELVSRTWPLKKYARNLRATASSSDGGTVNGSHLDRT